MPKHHVERPPLGLGDSRDDRVWRRGFVAGKAGETELMPWDMGPSDISAWELGYHAGQRERKP